MKEEKRKKIIYTARKLFIENGYSETKVEDITKAMGISKGNFYTYFKTKEEILELIIENIKIENKKLLENIDRTLNAKEILEQFLKEKANHYFKNFSKFNFSNINQILNSECIMMNIKEIKDLEINFINENILKKIFKNKENYDENKMEKKCDILVDFIQTSIDSFLFKENLENEIVNKDTYYEDNKEKFDIILNFLEKGLLNF